jgi:hypothetical protein
MDSTQAVEVELEWHLRTACTAAKPATEYLTNGRTVTYVQEEWMDLHPEDSFAGATVKKWVYFHFCTMILSGTAGRTGLGDF